MKTTILLVVVTSLVLSACAVGGRPASPALAKPLPQCPASGTIPSQGCITQCRDPLNKSCPMLLNVPTEVDEIKLTDEELPQLGLALSGGGSKAAPFAMGVIKRFVDNDWIFRTQYLTSVSGGSYAALYLYYRAYRAIMAENERLNPDDPKITPPEVPVQYDPEWPGLRRYFADARNINDYEALWPYVTIHSSDLQKNGEPRPYSLASNIKGCLDFATVEGGASPGELSEMWQGQRQELYQGWVECYQDMLMTHPAVESKATVDDSQLAEDFELLFVESAAAAPAHYFANILFDWKKRLSPTQYDYLYGIERTYAFFPMPGGPLPRHLHEKVFQQMANCLDFKDIAEIYMADNTRTTSAIGGYLPKWVLESTANNGNVGLNLTPAHYDLSQDVFEISFDEYGSGRFGYVKGAPSVIGLTVPYAVLASAAFADTAQRSLTVPRGVVDVAIQGLDVKWGFDVANYNVSNERRILHSFLIWPFYYVDDPTDPNNEKTADAPTIHLSDGGQSGDNLGLIAMFRRGVRNIVVAAGEDDFNTRDDPDPDGWLDLGSLCSANYYLIQRGFTLEFEADPRDPGPASSTKPFNLKDYCSWDGNREVYIHPDTKNVPPHNITPFNWVRRVWIGTVIKYDKPPFPVADPGKYPELPKPQEAWTRDAEIPPNLEGIKVYYLNAALDRKRWNTLAGDWYPQTEFGNYATLPEYPLTESNGYGQWSSPIGAWSLAEAWYPAFVPSMTTLPLRERWCEGEMAAIEGKDPVSMREVRYSCPLMAYVYATQDAVDRHLMKQWHFPQTSTWFTTFDNSINLFRAYRDLGWDYAGALADVPELAKILNAPPNPPPVSFQKDFPSAATAYRDPNVCKGWVGAPKHPAETNASD